MKSLLSLVVAQIAASVFIPNGARAETQVVAKRLIEEVYFTPHSVGLNITTYNWFNASNGCYQTVTADSRILFAIGYLVKRSDITVQNVHEGSNTGCRAKVPIEQVFMQNEPDWFKTGTTLSLVSMSRGLDSILGKIAYEGPVVASAISASGRSRVEYPFKAKLTQCQRQSGEMVKASELNQEIGTKGDLQQALASIRDLELNRLVRCEFHVDVGSILGDLEKREQIQHPDFKFSIIQNDDRVLVQQSVVTSWDRLYEKRNTEAESRALVATQALLRFISEDYGDLLYKINDLKKPEAEKEEIIRGFFDRNHEKIRAALSEIDSNYSEVSLMNKIAILTSFDQMYASIRQIESRVSKSNVTLDRVVRRPVR